MLTPKEFEQITLEPFASLFGSGGLGGHTIGSQAADSFVGWEEPVPDGRDWDGAFCKGDQMISISRWGCGTPSNTCLLVVLLTKFRFCQAMTPHQIRDPRSRLLDLRDCPAKDSVEVEAHRARRHVCSNDQSVEDRAPSLTSSWHLTGDLSPIKDGNIANKSQQFRIREIEFRAHLAADFVEILVAPEKAKEDAEPVEDVEGWLKGLVLG